MCFSIVKRFKHLHQNCHFDHLFLLKFKSSFAYMLVLGSDRHPTYLDLSRQFPLAHALAPTCDENVFSFIHFYFSDFPENKHLKLIHFFFILSFVLRLRSLSRNPGIPNCTLVNYLFLIVENLYLKIL
jgi:hypothetical protein